MEELQKQPNTEYLIADGVSMETRTDNTVRRHMPVIEQLSIALGILVLIFGTAYVPDTLKKIDESTVLNAEEMPAVHRDTESTKQVDAFGSVSLEAKAAYVWDVKEEKALYAHNADAPLPIASLTKLMTALVAYELLGSDATVAIGADAIAQEGDSGFGVGERFTSQNLLDLTLLNSSNDGAYALAAAAGASLVQNGDSAAIFVDAMNIRAEELGLTHSSFGNPTGLDMAGSTPGAVGSARDMALLLEHIISTYPETLEFTRKSETRIENSFGLLHDAENTNSIAAAIPGLIASKTGYTELAGGNLIVAFDAGLNHPVIISVLGSSRQGRFDDVETLVKAVRAEFAGNL